MWFQPPVTFPSEYGPVSLPIVKIFMMIGPVHSDITGIKGTVKKKEKKQVKQQQNIIARSRGMQGLGGLI